jgi:hypothetical protein
VVTHYAAQEFLIFYEWTGGCVRALEGGYDKVIEKGEERDFYDDEVLL